MSNKNTDIEDIRQRICTEVTKIKEEMKLKVILQFIMGISGK